MKQDRRSHHVTVRNSFAILIPDLFKNVAPSKPVFAGFGPATPAPIFGAKPAEKEAEAKIFGEPSAKKSAFERSENVFGSKLGDRDQPRQETVPPSFVKSAAPNIFGAKFEKGPAAEDRKTAVNIFGDSGPKKAVFESTASSTNIFGARADDDSKQTAKLFGGVDPAAASKKSGFEPPSGFGRSSVFGQPPGGATAESKLFGKPGQSVNGGLHFSNWNLVS